MQNITPTTSLAGISPPLSDEIAQQPGQFSTFQVTSSTRPLSNIYKDVAIFSGASGCPLPDRNIIVSPLLISTTEKITDTVMKEAGFKRGVINPECGLQPRKNISSTQQGLHVLSKREYIDATLERLQFPYTASGDVTPERFQIVTDELNERIAKDTNGMITNFLNPDILENPDLAFQLVTWLFQQVSWSEPFIPIDQDISSNNLKWNGNQGPKISWVESDHSNTIAHISTNGFNFISLPVQESGIKAIFVLPPQDINNQNADSLTEILSDGLSSVLKESYHSDARLTFPKYQFDYEYEKEYPQAGASGKHKAALKIDEEGAAVAAASSMCVTDGLSSPPELHFTLDRPFYFAMVNTQNRQDPRIVGMAFINQPWND